ncbi:hypothetical protein AzCIB_0695 [Azoarcus sp. CIB]|nr:hypothetical protein AzCIB_0695 [Azoarcus sp. CIB]
MRGQFVGFAPRVFVRSADLPYGLHDRHGGVRRDLRRREAPVPRDQGDRGQGESAGDLRVPDLPAGNDRRRRRGGVQGGEREVRHASDPGERARLRGQQEPRQQAGRRGAARLCRRHAGAGIYDGLRHQPDRRVQRGRRVLAGEAALRRAGHPRAGDLLRRRALPRHRGLAPRQGGDHAVLAGADQHRAQDGRALRHPLLRGQLLRHRGHVGLPAPDLAPAGRTRRAGRPAGARRGADRTRGGARVGAAGEVPRAAGGQAGAAFLRAA